MGWPSWRGWSARVGVGASLSGHGPKGQDRRPSSWETYRRVFPDAVIPPTPPAITRLADPTGFQAEMEAAGFGEVRVHAVGGTYEAPSADWIVANMDRLFRFAPLYNALRPPDRTRLGTALRDA